VVQTTQFRHWPTQQYLQRLTLDQTNCEYNSKGASTGIAAAVHFKLGLLEQPLTLAVCKLCDLFRLAAMASLPTISEDSTANADIQILSAAAAAPSGSRHTSRRSRSRSRSPRSRSPRSRSPHRSSRSDRRSRSPRKKSRRRRSRSRSASSSSSDDSSDSDSSGRDRKRSKRSKKSRRPSRSRSRSRERDSKRAKREKRKKQRKEEKRREEKARPAAESVPSPADETDTWSDGSRGRSAAATAAAAKAAAPAAAVGQLTVLWKNSYGLIEKTILQAGMYLMRVSCCQHVGCSACCSLAICVSVCFRMALPALLDPTPTHTYSLQALAR